jgi:hypothetical protein
VDADFFNFNKLVFVLMSHFIALNDIEITARDMLRNILLLLLAAVVASTAQTSTSSSSPKMETTHVDLAWEHANNLVLTDDRAAWVRLAEN